MKNKIWRNWKMTGVAFIMSWSLLIGNGSAVLGADGDGQKMAVLQEMEQLPDIFEENFEPGKKDGEVSKADLAGSDIFLEEVEKENPSGDSGTGKALDFEEIEEQIRETEAAETPEITEISEITGDPDATDTPPFTDSEDKDRTASCKMWITPQQTQIKAGKELLYTISVENTGRYPLKNICLQTAFSDASLEGTWEEAEGAEIQEKILKLETLETGIKKEFYFSVQLPEAQSGKICLYLNGSAEYEEEETGELRSLVAAEESSETEIFPLKADFQVTKTADRTMAMPGDKIIFQICIRNTGERTLHSVVTTEKFQLENVPVQFLEAEGVILNKDRTKAKIEKIDPECSVGLLAEVTLPENLKEPKLINEVIVVTAETGERKVTSRAELQIYKMAETPTSEPQISSDEGAETQNTELQSKTASTHPKTGDPMKPVLWLMMIPGSFLSAVWVCRRLKN